MSDATAANDLVRFFHALPAAAQREYRALADADRSFGEDVAAERRARDGDRDRDRDEGG